MYFGEKYYSKRSKWSLRFDHFCHFSPKLKHFESGPCGFSFIVIFIQKQNMFRFFNYHPVFCPFSPF
ncbi:hypothetical protein Hanom_Chr03g00269801 [Helianthus anomalus]